MGGRYEIPFGLGKCENLAQRTSSGEQFTGQLKCLAFKEVRIINLDLKLLGQYFLQDIVRVWNYKESSGTVFRAGEVCTVKANAGRVF